MEGFRDRADAGRRLADHLEGYAGRKDVIVLALPRGGVPVAWEVARSLHVPLDVFLVRKLGVPGQPELAMGAIASGGVRVLNPQVVDALGIDDDTIERTAAEQSREIERRQTEYRGTRPPPPIAGRSVILVDDGLATGSTMRAAVAAVRTHGPGRIIVAVPVAPPATCATLRQEVDELVCLVQPEPFMAVGAWYQRFEQTTDEEVRAVLRRAEEEGLAPPAP